MHVGLGVGYDEVEAEVDAPECEEESWRSMSVRSGEGDALFDRMYLPADIRRNDTSLNMLQSI